MILIIVGYGNNEAPPTVTHIPFATKAACEAAQKDLTLWPSNYTWVRAVTASCFPTGQ